MLSLLSRPAAEPGATRRRLPVELWALIFTSVHDLPSLSSCAKVSRVLYEAAMPSLYGTVVVRELNTLNGEMPPKSPFIAINAHPHLRMYVRTVIHEAFPTPRFRDRTPPVNGTQWTAQLPMLPNLTSYRFAPSLPLDMTTISLFSALVDVLLECHSLVDVTWQCSIDETTLPIVLRLTQVRNLTINYLQRSANLKWLDHLEGTYRLEELHILVKLWLL
ncbi:hypothetical protein BV25DRAFT_1371041 [Artomyces pyxidatus]|uniref:Uncharacterized protein n=1 Tax=Artomyces pyxidatus TaxID=48021 RepID=A0ACB8SN08_9AGAM|nr:hypothetical protein BV25DRAFT_1371041 [Artomyces pyxidatus]